jgi:selenocysteine-specific elongation factor
VHVIATAGHVDHGKSTLIRALTGMEPDRWAEERRRGMTIDLGYAWADLPSGARAAFIDVPGHERFVANMLAGVGQVPAALLVVAADEGWRAQTIEHFDSLLAFGVRHLLVAISCSDRAAPDATVTDSRRRLDAAGLEDAEIVPVSAITGAGTPELLDALDRLVRRLPVPDISSPARLWIDRVFTISGAGTVVTGTLTGGGLAVGDEVEIGPDGLRATVRGLESCKQAVPRIDAVARVAVNLRGLTTTQLHRGCALVAPGSTSTATTLDVALSAPVVAGEYMVFLGSAAVPVRVRPLGAAPSRFARLTMTAALSVRIADRGVIRDPGRHLVLAGFQVMDIDPARLHRRGDAVARAAQLQLAESRPPGADLLGWRGWLTASRARQLGVLDPGGRTVADIHVSNGRWSQWSLDLAELVRHSPADGVTEGEVQQSLGLPMPELLAAIVAESGDVKAVDGRLFPTESQPLLDAAGTAALAALEQRLTATPFDPPDRHGLDELGLDRRTLAAAARAGRLLRVGPDVYLRPDAADQAIAALRKLGGPFTVGEARDALASSRRVVLPLLQHLDAARRTRRLDDTLRELT